MSTNELRDRQRITYEAMQDFERYCPFTCRTIFGRRYLLPNKRQSDYCNQDILDRHLKTMLVSWAVHEVDRKNEAEVTEMGVLIHGIRYNRPTLYLERELGEALQRTDLPEYLSTEDVRWPWSGSRVVLPKGLCRSIGPDGDPTSLHCIDVALSQPGEEVQLSGKMLGEIVLGLEKCGYQVYREQIAMKWAHPDVAISAGSGLTDFQIDGFEPDTISWAAPWVNQKLREAVKSKRVMTGGKTDEPVPTDLLERARHLLFNVLIFLSQEPVDPNETYLRKPRMEGKHFKPGLVRARFVGECQPKSRKAVGARKTKGDATGTHAAHWVRGHWTRIAHGRGRTLRRLTWIQPYHTGDQEDESIW
jgi:hypothetical protein